MKKILLFWCIMTGCLVSVDVLAQNSGLYFSTGDAFLSSGFSFDENNNGDYYRLKESDTYISVALGYKAKDGYGLEFTAAVEANVLKEPTRKIQDYEPYRVSTFAWGGSVFYSSNITNEISWMFMLSFRFLDYTEKSYSQDFYDFQIEPITFEYRRRDSHWGFKLSALTLEVMTMKKEKQNPNSFDVQSYMGTTGVGINLNSFPIRVSYYF